VDGFDLGSIHGAVVVLDANKRNESCATAVWNLGAGIMAASAPTCDTGLGHGPNSCASQRVARPAALAAQNLGVRTGEKGHSRSAVTDQSARRGTQFCQTDFVR